MNRKICVVTGTRAEYGLICRLMKEIKNDSDLDLQIIVTGAHLSPEFGLTYREIERDGFKIDEKIEMLLSSDTPVGITKSMGIELISFADALERLKPDIMVLLGDRYEILIASVAALTENIPVAHIAGGDVTEGAIDDSIRHCITKLSHIHFAARYEHVQRIKQLGENPEHIYEIGALGLDNIVRMNFLSLKELEKSIDFVLGEKFFLVTYHPVTVKEYAVSNALQNLFDALDNFPDYKILFTKSNSDAGGMSINKQIDDYATKNSKRVFACSSLGQLRYLSAMKHCSVVVGNSSSGIWEAPALKVPTVNIGARQQGRHREISIIDCAEESSSIVDAIRKATSPRFRNSIQNMRIKHMDGNIAARIKNILRDISLDGICKKHFFDFV